MSCPTCGRDDMMRLAAATIHGDYSAHWCRRCGTLVEDGGKDDPHPVDVRTPAIIACCRKFAASAVGVGSLDEDQVKLLWQACSIPECINPPGDQKK